MNPVNTVATMVGLFVVIGCAIPIIMIAMKRNNNHLILWIMMSFAIILVFGVTVDFSALDHEVRITIVKYGLTLVGIFGAFFGLDMLFSKEYISNIKWHSLNIETRDSDVEKHVVDSSEDIEKQ